ncbi:filamin A-interacting protein 1-like [Nerophis lumbriciformis]|uniref:filamin A-interacting protein 1-like n=1 Tax=Nerophis lumbriciformis TaxID=546530 RepID=UPI003BAD8FFE
MHPVFKSSKSVHWEQASPKKPNCKSCDVPIPDIPNPPEIPIQRGNGPDYKRHKRERRHAAKADLSRDDMLFLLSVLEGELQASDEVIAALKSEKTDFVVLRAHYGFISLEGALRALHRDSMRLRQQENLQDEWKTPTAEKNNFTKSQKLSFKRMQDKLLEVSSSYRDAIHKIEEQERSHRDFVHKSNCITMLLEEDRERLVQHAS